MVPGSFGCGSVVLAAIATLAPSRAARSPMASPMPRDAPVMNRVLPLSDMLASQFLVYANGSVSLPGGRPFVLADADDVSVRIADVEVTAAVGLVFRLAVESNTAGGDIRGHRIHIIDVESKRPSTG